MDVLSDVLRVVRLSGAVFFTADFSSPWALESPIPDVLASAMMPQAECVVLFHILVDGECEVVCQGHPVPRWTVAMSSSSRAAISTPCAATPPRHSDRRSRPSFRLASTMSRHSCLTAGADARHVSCAAI